MAILTLYLFLASLSLAHTVRLWREETRRFEEAFREKP